MGRAEAARVAVGVVLLVAGAAKLAQPAWRATAAGFGAPPRLVAALPWLEVVVGAAVLAALAMPWSAWAALVLLAAFTLALAGRLRRGDRAPCRCFGESTPVPVGAATLARNLVLCTLALVAALGGGGGGGTGAGPALAGGAIGAAVVLGSRRPGRGDR